MHLNRRKEFSNYQHICTEWQMWVYRAFASSVSMEDITSQSLIVLLSKPMVNCRIILNSGF